jgi:hypothetical protein
MAKLQSMDVTIRGVTRSYEFNPPEDFGEGDEGTISMSALEEAETTEVQLVGGFSEATVTVSYSIRHDGNVTVDLADVAAYSTYDDLRNGIERGDFDEVAEAIQDDIERNLEASDASIDSVEDLEVTDENGETVDEF